MGNRIPRRVLAAGRRRSALTATGSVLTALVLTLGTGAGAASADDGPPLPDPTVPTGPVEPGPTDPPTEPTPEPEPEPDPPVVILPPVDTQQPPASVRVLPRRCVGDGTMPATALPCEVLRAGPRRPLVVIWGDSHSWQQTPGIIAAARDNRHVLMTFQLGACPPMVLKTSEARGGCADLGRSAIATIRAQAKKRPVRVVLGGYWHGYLAPRGDQSTVSRQAPLFQVGGPRAFNALKRIPHVRTVGIGQQPTLGLGVAIPALDLPRAQVVPQEANVAAWLKRHVDQVVSPTSVLCRPATCFSSVAHHSV
ncbi:MAG: hypothetical protein JWN84_1799 [Nocardioides sp.]|nr:hypothetical protein [Nocardioides sp.]